MLDVHDGSLAKPDTPYRTYLCGFVASSINLQGRKWREIEHMLGYHIGRFDRGGSAYAIEPAIVRNFVANPPAYFAEFGLWPMGHNDERGTRDWAAVAKGGNGYSAASIFRDRTEYERRWPSFDAENAAVRGDMAAEMASMLFAGGTLIKFIPELQHSNFLAADQQYPAGAGLREYVLTKEHPFTRIRRFNASQIDADRTFDSPV